MRDAEDMPSGGLFYLYMIELHDRLSEVLRTGKARGFCFTEGKGVLWEEAN